jgi:hypothetical protein
MDLGREAMASQNQATEAEFEAVIEAATTPSAAADDEDALILWMLSLDATRRLEVAQGFVDSIELLRHGRRD